LSSSISLGSLLFFDDTIKTKKKITDGEENWEKFLSLSQNKAKNKCVAQNSKTNINIEEEVFWEGDF
jgi:hypothetical protein